MKKHNLLNESFGKLTVISKLPPNQNGSILWNCQCECGKCTQVTTHRLLSGKTKSCGCLRNLYVKHGLSSKDKRLYKIWKDMRERCNNPNRKSYRWYGLKGIKVCKEWNDYSIFYNWSIQNGYTSTLTIDRIDSSQGYNPTNCQWLSLSDNVRKAQLIIKN